VVGVGGGLGKGECGGAPMRLFYGALGDLTFDPGNWKWNRLVELMSYMAKQGRQLIKSRSILARDVFEKWEGSFFHNFKLNRRDVWNKCKGKKDLGFMWLLWHQTIAINSWRANTNYNIPMDCSSYECATQKFVTQNFWFCLKVMKAWELAFSFHFQLGLLINIIGSEKTLKFEQCLFNKWLLNGSRNSTPYGPYLEELLCGPFGLKETI